MSWMRRLTARLRGAPRFGELRGRSPLEIGHGVAGTPSVAAHYVERFLARHAGVLPPATDRVRVLIGFGTERLAGLDAFAGSAGESSAVESSAVESGAVESGAAASSAIEGDDDLARHLASWGANSLDGVLLLHVLDRAREPGAALAAAWRALRPGGVMLATVPGVTCVPPAVAGASLRAFTPYSMRTLAREALAGATFEVESYGNVLAATLAVLGASARSVAARRLDVADPHYPVVIGLAAREADT